MKLSTFAGYAAAAALLCALGNLPGWAADKDSDANGAASPAAGDAAKKPASKDPTASAFALPKGVTLNAKQHAAYDRLKADKEPLLQQAIDDLQNSKDGSTALAKKVRDLRAEIRNAIYDILASSVTGANSGGSGQEVPAPAYAVPYAVPYYGYYSYWPYGYYPYRPYYYNHRYYHKSGDGKGKYAANGATGKPAGQNSPPPRPSGGSTSGGGSRR